MKKKIQEQEPILYNTMILYNQEDEVEYPGEYTASQIDKIKGSIGRDQIITFRNGGVNLKFFYEVKFINKEED